MTNLLYRSAAGEQAVMDFYSQMMDHWPVPFDGITIETRHGDTFAIASGAPSAPPLVLLHGSCSNAVAWAGDVAEYSRYFRVFAVDLPGEPGRSSPTRPPWKGPAYVEWLDDVLSSLGVDCVSLLGLSQGGWVALKYASARPERVTRVVLLAPGGVVPARLSFIFRSVVLTALGSRGAEALNRAIFGTAAVHPAAREFMGLIMTHFRPRMGVLPLLTDEELDRLTMPTLLIAGTEDAVLPSEKTAARLNKHLPYLTERILAETGHVLVNLTGEIIPFLTALGEHPNSSPEAI